MNRSMVAAAGCPSPLLLPRDQWRARCSLILASNINFVDFDSLTSIQVFYPKRYRSDISLKLGGARIWREPSPAASFYKPDCRPSNSLIVRCSSSSGNNDADSTELEGKKLTNPSFVGVESLLTTICDTTSIAEFKMELAGFQLYVKRGLVEKSVPSSVQSQLSVQPSIANQIVESNGSAGTTSLAVTETKTSSCSIQRIVDTASDEGLVILQSPKVGLFRRSRTIKGKKAPPSCKEKQQVKEGQVLCYIEQLGGEIPIEADVSGEVIKILRKDGEPVGYADALIAILPSFPGIKKLQ